MIELWPGAPDNAICVVPHGLVVQYAAIQFLLKYIPKMSDNVIKGSFEHLRDYIKGFRYVVSEQHSPQVCLEYTGIKQSVRARIGSVPPSLTDI